MREGFRPYTKVVTLTSTGVGQLATHDTSGNVLECNYCKVEPVSGAGLTGSGFFFVTVDVESGQGYTNADQATTVKERADTSGSLGMGSNRQTGAVVISTISPDFFSAIKISQTDAAATKYLVTYGVVAESNGIKDSRTFRGN